MCAVIMSSPYPPQRRIQGLARVRRHWHADRNDTKIGVHTNKLACIHLLFGGAVTQHAVVAATPRHTTHRKGV